MTMTVTSEGRFVRIVLDGDVLVPDVQAMHGSLAPYAKADAVVALSASGVTRIDTAVMQLVVALARSVSALEVESESDAWRETWRCLGLDRVTPPGSSGAEEV